MLLQNIMSTLYNVRNMSKVQYNNTKFITRIIKMESLFYKNKNIQKLLIKHLNIIKAKTIHMIMKDIYFDWKYKSMFHCKFLTPMQTHGFNVT